MIENLENRLMFYTYPNGVTVVYEPDNSISVYGTQGNDQLMFAQTGEGTNIQIWSGYNGPANPGYPFTEFNALWNGAPRRVQVYGQSGDDLLFITEQVHGIRVTLDGGYNNDTLIGGVNNADTFVGGSGRDTVSYVNRQQKLTVSIDNVANDGAAGEGDNVKSDVEVVVGGDKDDTIYGSNGDNQLEGGPGRDKLFGLGGWDRLLGGTEDDTLDGGFGPDRFDGGEGHDTATYETRYADINVSLDGFNNDGAESGEEGDNVLDTIETVVGGFGKDTISLKNSGPAGVSRVARGGPSTDWLYGSDARDVFSGGEGDDFLYTSPGNDYYMGDEGTDMMVYENYYNPTGLGVVVTLDGNDNDGVPGEKDNVRADIEYLTGTKFDDVLKASTTGVPINNLIRGDGGNDRIYGYGGDDRLFGDDGSDWLDGGEGKDFLQGGLLNDTLIGGNGIDTANYADKYNPVTVDIDGAPDDGTAGENDDVETDVENIIGSSSDDVIRGSASSNILDGGFGDDEIYGGGNWDTLLGGKGNDDLYGEDGNDTLDGGDNGDRIDGGPGTDTVDYSKRTRDLRVTLDGIANDGTLYVEHDDVRPNVENVRAGSGDDIIEGPQTGSASNEFWGGGGADTLRGFGGIDTLHGDAGVDSLFGGDGTDVLDGGTGGDTLDGGNGDDNAWYGNRTKTLVLTLDNLKNDGEEGENDLIQNNVEGLTGGSGHDYLTGDGAANKLYGMAGNDTITGGGGVDLLVGGADNDTLISRDSVIDDLYGGSGYDKARVDNDDDLTDVETLLG